MDFFEDLGEALNRTAKVAVQKGEEFAEKSKIGIEIVAAREKLTADFTAIGERLYKYHKTELNAIEDEKLKEIVQNAQKNEARFTELYEKKKTMDSRELCKKCGKKLIKDAEYCPHCGEKI